MTVKATKLINIDSLKTFKDKLDEAHSSLMNTRITNDQTNRISSITVDSTTKLPSAASDGFCSKPCKYGKLQKQIAELQKKIKDEQSEASIWPKKP